MILLPGKRRKIFIVHTWNRVAEKMNIPIASETLKILSLGAICCIQSEIKCHTRCNVIRLKEQIIQFSKNKV